MFTFAAPSLLFAGPAVAALGLWALWRGRHHVQRVSSTRLWAGLTAEAAGKRMRVIDPVWLLVFAAAVLAGLALAGPRWVMPGTAESGAAPRGEVEWSLRALAGSAKAELFVRVRDGAHLPDSCALRITDNSAAPGEDASDRLPAAARVVMVKSADLLQGTPVQVENTPALRVALNADKTTLAEVLFVRQDHAPFALLTATGRGGRVDPALWHVFAVQPAVVTNDPAVRPAVLLVDDPLFRAGEVDDRTLVIASPRTPMPGITPAAGAATRAAATNPEAGWKTTNAVPQSRQLKLKAVHVRRYMQAELSPDWQVIATIDGSPWLAVRAQRPTAGTPARHWIWLASNPTGDSDWGLDISFVLFFGEQLDLMYPPAQTQGEPGVVEWTERRMPTAPPKPARMISLVPALGASAAALPLLAVLLLLRRVRVAPR